MFIFFKEKLPFMRYWYFLQKTHKAFLNAYIDVPLSHNLINSPSDICMVYKNVHLPFFIEVHTVNML